MLDEDEDGELHEYNDANIFAVSVVPLRLSEETKSIHQKTVWNNDNPSSIGLCRPKSLVFEKESSLLTNRVVSKMYAEIEELKPTKIGAVSVRTKMCFTMVDTKVINDLSNTHSQLCYICKRSGKKLNLAIESVDSDDPGIYKFGISPLHAYIRSMELMLKISYRLSMSKPTWKVSKKNTEVKQREENIRSALKEQLGLRISEPRPGGGNSNSGNVARRFFQERDEVSKITGLDGNLLERFFVILSLINSRAEIDVAAYKNYAEETRLMYDNLYGWYALSPTVHKLLVHGAAIIQHSLLPIGMFSEEAGESRNKSIRKFREGHARKFNREVNMEDVFKRLLFTSDPVISLTNRKKVCFSELRLPEHVKHLIL